MRGNTMPNWLVKSSKRCKEVILDSIFNFHVSLIVMGDARKAVIGFFLAAPLYFLFESYFPGIEKAVLFIIIISTLFLLNFVRLSIEPYFALILSKVFLVPVVKIYNESGTIEIYRYLDIDDDKKYCVRLNRETFYLYPSGNMHKDTGEPISSPMMFWKFV